MAISTLSRNKKKYSVGGYSGSRFAYADTLAEAKEAGASIARKEAWKGKWNVMYIPVSIRKADASVPVYYGKAGWSMFVPVRGTGMRAEAILASIKRREGVEAFKWRKKG